MPVRQLDLSFVIAAYQRLLGRGPNVDDLIRWSGDLSSSQDRTKLAALPSSDEARGRAHDRDLTRRRIGRARLVDNLTRAAQLDSLLADMARLVERTERLDEQVAEMHDEVASRLSEIKPQSAAGACPPAPST